MSLIKKSVLSKLFVSVAATLMAAPLAVPVNMASFVAAQPVKQGDNYSFDQKYHTDKVNVKLAEDAQVNLENSDFKAKQGNDANAARKADKLNKRLEKAGKRAVRKMNRTEFGQSNALVNQINEKLSNYYTIDVAPGQDVNQLVRDLDATEGVADAYLAAKPAPSPTVQNYTSRQNYLKDSPEGTGATFAKQYPGGNGSGVRIYDLEYSWNLDHEDLANARAGVIRNGTPVDPFNDNSHGTAVLGELIATDNNIGVTGAAPGASIRLINTYNTERGWDILGALVYAAFSGGSKGDVILIEQQTWAPYPLTGYVPVEWEPQLYDVIKVLTDYGFNVVQAAGNSGHNLDDTTIFGATFPMGKAHSGSIIVGAGSACDTTRMRGRLWFSNYGKRVELQGHGECVVTTGYGSLEGGSPNGYYTSIFDGTSSASPSVAASVASLVGSFKALHAGRVLTPPEVRFILIFTGTPQNTSSWMLSGNIGPEPNLNYVMANVADQVAPTAPASIQTTLVNGRPRITWAASTDNVRVKEYHIYRNGWTAPQVVVAPTLTLNDTSTSAKGTYSYRVQAVDISGKKSAFTSWSYVTIP